jgi:HD-like signal output (HDOD) protein
LFQELDGSHSNADRDFLTRLVRTLGAETLDFPLFPDVAWKLDRLLKEGNPPIVRVAQLIRREPEMVRRVWQQASSVAYARKVGSLDHAIARIGFDSLWRIAMSACMYSPVFRVPGFQAEVDQARAHGIVTAEVVSWLTKARMGDVFLAGLLHNIGKLVVYRSALTKRTQVAPSHDLVERMAQRYHAGIGVLVMRDWRMSDLVVAGVGFHPDPSCGAGEDRELAAFVRVAAISAYTAEQARQGNDCGGLQDLVCIDEVNFDPARTIVKAHDIFDSIADLTSSSQKKATESA